MKTGNQIHGGCANCVNLYIICTKLMHCCELQAYFVSNLIMILKVTCKQQCKFKPSNFSFQLCIFGCNVNSKPVNMSFECSIQVGQSLLQFNMKFTDANFQNLS